MVNRDKFQIKDLQAVPETAAKRIEELKSTIEKAVETITKSNALIEERLSTVEEKTKSLSEAKKKVEASLGGHVLVEDRINSEVWWPLLALASFSPFLAHMPLV